VHCVIPNAALTTEYNDCIVYTDCIFNSLAFFLTIKAMTKSIFVQVYNNELEYNDVIYNNDIIDQTESRYKSL